MKKSIEAFKKMNRKNKIILVSILSGIILVFGATTFAFFSSSINGEKQPLSVTTGTLRLDFNDVEGSGIIEGEMGIGKTVSKRMMISNTGTQDATATIMWNELENTYLAQSLMYTIKQTQEYDINEETNINTLEYNQEVPEAGIYVPRSEEPKKTALTRGLLIPAGKKIYYEVTITYNHLNDVDQNADLEARLYTSFTIEEGEQLEPFTITYYSRSKIGWNANTTDLIIPATFQDEKGVWRKVVSIQPIKRGSTILFGAFQGSTKLKSLTIPDSVTKIGNGAFKGCSSLTSIIIGSGITNIGSSIFINCTNLTSITIDENNKAYKSLDGVVFTKDENTLVRYPAGKSADSYIVPDIVTNIGNYAFYGCKSLTSITIPDSVTNIGNSAFSGCRSLTSIEIPNGVASIGSSTFSGCTSLTSVTIPEGVTSIGNNALNNCTGLTSIAIPDGVTSIGDNAFAGCKSLIYINVDEDNQAYKTMEGILFTRDGKSLIRYPIGKVDDCYIIPDSVTSIEVYAFQDCTGLISITMPNSVTSIGSYAFSGCSSLTSVTIPNSVTNIDDRAFQSCSSLTSITVPDSVTSIGDYAFNYCNSLLSIDVDSNNSTYKSIDGVLFTKDEKTIIKYPSGKTDTSYTIPDTVTSIGSSAFYYCRGLTSIIIPDSVTSIGNSVFYKCTGLTTVTYKGTAYTSESAFTTAFTSTTGNTIGTNAFYNTKLTA